MWTFAQILIDVVFAIGLLVLASAHIAGRSTSDELDVFRDIVEHELAKIGAKVDSITGRKH